MNINAYNVAKILMPSNVLSLRDLCTFVVLQQPLIGNQYWNVTS